MSKKEYKSLNDFTIEQLSTIRQEIISAETKDDLLITLDSIIADKNSKLHSLNSRFPIDWMNIDIQYLHLLHANGIENLAQLRDVEDLSAIPGITQHGLAQITWAKEFFDMSDIENMPIKTQDAQLEVAKVIVKHSKECSTKHPTK